MILTTRCRRLFRRNCLLITLLLLVLAVTYFRRTKKDMPILTLPTLPKKLDKFLRDSQHQLKESINIVMRHQNPASLLFHEHFTESREDGTKLLWIHESEFHTPLDNETNSMVDINSITDTNGYIKIEAVDTILKEGRHGIHLHVSSIGQAKVVLAALSTRPYIIATPVLISAKVLNGPNVEHCRREKMCSFSEPIIAESLLSLLKAELRAQVGLSWTDYFDASTINQGYSWRMVMAMFELTREVRKDNLSLVFMVRAALARNSIPQLYWLSEVSNANLVLESNAEDAKLKYLPDDIALMHNIIPKSRVFLRMPQNLRNATLERLNKFSMPSDWQTYITDVAYVDQDWKVMNEVDKKFFQKSVNAVLIYPSMSHPAYLGTEGSHSLAPRAITTITGRVIFFEEKENMQSGKFNSGLKIYIDTKFAEIQNFGTQILIGSSGYVSISSYSTRRDVIMSDNKLKTINPCYQFSIEAEPRGLDVTLTSPIDCDFPMAQKSRESIKLRLDITLSGNPFQIYLQTVGKEPVLIDQFRVKK